MLKDDHTLCVKEVSQMRSVSEFSASMELTIYSLLSQNMGTFEGK